MLAKCFNRVAGLFLLTLATLLPGCQSYSVQLNNNLVYSPRALFKDFSISDAQLRTCVEQSILDNHITEADDLKQLNCSHAGIQSLAGLEVFHGITRLNLAENSLQSIAPLSHFSQLQILNLRQNNLGSAEPLLHTLALRELDISVNAELACTDLKQLVANFPPGQLKIVLPQQCL